MPKVGNCCAWLLIVVCADAAMAQKPPVPENILAPALNASAPLAATVADAGPKVAARSLGEQMESANNNYSRYLEIYKTIKLRELGPGADAPATPVKPAQTSAANSSKPRVPSTRKVERSAPEPRLWYLSGLGGQIAAELFFERKVYRIESGHVPQRVGPWEVRSVDSRGVALLLTDSSRQVWLEAPRRGDDPKLMLDAIAPVPAQGTDKAGLPKLASFSLPGADVATASTVPTAPALPKPATSALSELANFALPIVMPKP